MLLVELAVSVLPLSVSVVLESMVQFVINLVIRLAIISVDNIVRSSLGNSFSLLMVNMFTLSNTVPKKTKRKNKRDVKIKW